MATDAESSADGYRTSRIGNPNRCQSPYRRSSHSRTRYPISNRYSRSPLLRSASGPTRYPSILSGSEAPRDGGSSGMGSRYHGYSRCFESDLRDVHYREGWFDRNGCFRILYGASYPSRRGISLPRFEGESIPPSSPISCGENGFSLGFL